MLILVSGLVKIQKCMGATCDGGDDWMKKRTISMRLEEPKNSLHKEVANLVMINFTMIPWPGRYSLMRTWFGFLSAGNMPISETLST
jgi:hypothetical protein